MSMILSNKGVAHPWQCDVQGHLTTRFYVELFDDASYHFLHEVFGDSGQLGWADVRQEIDYLAEVGAGDLLEIRAALVKIGGKSATIRYDMDNLSRSEKAATMTTVSVLFDLEARKAVALDDTMRQSASRFLPPAQDKG